MAEENPDAGAGAVVLDIGGEIGALVVDTPARLAGAELEICPLGRRTGSPDEGSGWWAGVWRHGHDHRATDRPPDGPAWPHVGVIRRRTPRGVGYAAVFPGLRQGTYELWLRPDQPTAVVASVRGGEVVTVGWPDQGE